MVGHVKPIPMPIILAAISGDEIALATVVLHYQGYIHVLATRPLKDDCGNERLCVDEDMRLRLEAKLIYAIITGFKILAAQGSILDFLSFNSSYIVERGNYARKRVHTTTASKALGRNCGLPY